VIVKSENTDAVELAAMIAIERSRHADAESIDGRRRSRQAIRRWARRLPAGLAIANDVPLLIARHREYWLGSASTLPRSLDPAGLGAGPLHAVGFDAVGADSLTVVGMTFPVLFDCVRDALPVSAVPGPTLAINLVEIVTWLVLDNDDRLDEAGLREQIRVTVQAVALHEAAHVIADGGYEPLPPHDVPTATIHGIVRAAVAADKPQARVIESHGAAWCRAAVHLAHRTRTLPHGQWWADWLRADIDRIHNAGTAAAVVAALADELLAADQAEAVAEILRREPPSAFDDIFDKRR
jgi:hypothetical protein